LLGGHKGLSKILAHVKRLILKNIGKVFLNIGKNLMSPRMQATYTITGTPVEWTPFLPYPYTKFLSRPHAAHNCNAHTFEKYFDIFSYLFYLLHAT